MSEDEAPKRPNQEAQYICWVPDDDEVEYTRVHAPSPRAAAEHAAREACDASAPADSEVTIAVVRADGRVMNTLVMGVKMEGRILFFSVSVEWECSASASLEKPPVMDEEARERLREDLEDMGLGHIVDSIDEAGAYRATARGE